MNRKELFGQGIEAISPNITAQHRINCFYEVVIEGEKQKIAIRGTPGLTLLITLPEYPIRGWCEAGNYLYVVANQNIYQVCQNGGYVIVGSIGSATATPVSMAINESQIMIVDGVNGYIFNWILTTSNASSPFTSFAILDTITQNIGFP